MFGDGKGFFNQACLTECDDTSTGDETMIRGAGLFCFRVFICNYADTFSQLVIFLMRSHNCGTEYNRSGNGTNNEAESKRS